MPQLLASYFEECCRNNVFNPLLSPGGRHRACLPVSPACRTAPACLTARCPPHRALPPASGDEDGALQLWDVRQASGQQRQGPPLCSTPPSPDGLYPAWQGPEATAINAMALLADDPLEGAFGDLAPGSGSGSGGRRGALIALAYDSGGLALVQAGELQGADGEAEGAGGGRGRETRASWG